MSDRSDLYEVLDRWEESMFRQVIDEMEGKLGQEELADCTPCLTEEEYAKWKMRLDQLAGTRRRRRIDRRWLRHTVAVAAVLVVLFSLTAAAVNLKWFAFEEVDRGQFIQIQPGELPETRVAVWTDVYVPSYLPDGFFMSDAFQSGDAKMIEYANIEGTRISFYQYGLDSGIRLDSEDVEYQPYQIDGQDAWILQKDSRNTLYWYGKDGIQVFSIEYPIEIISETEIAQIAESLVYQSE